MQKDIAYFKDIYDVKPSQHDCTLGKLMLPWNNQEIDIFIDSNGSQLFYRPVVEGLYPDEKCGIGLGGESFTKKDWDEYVTTVKKWNEHLEWVQWEIEFNLDATYEIIKQRIQPAMLHAVGMFDPWLLIHSGNYALHYDPEQELYFIFKYKSNKPISSRYHWENLDEGFEPINSDNRSKIANEFIKLVEQEFYQLFSILLYEDEKCRCYFSKVLHFDLKIENRTLPFVLRFQPNTSTLHAECKDSRFSYSKKGQRPPLKLMNNEDEWETFCKEFAKIMMTHFLNIALPLVLPRCPMFEIEFTNNNVTYMNSKLGGSFFWPNDNPPSLRFLIQINFSELPENEMFPKSGMLQFFIGNDESFGLSDGKDGYQVVYHEDISSGHEIMQFFVDECCDVFDENANFSIKNVSNDCTPICKPCGMRFTITEEYMSIGDLRFEEHLGDLANEDDEVLEPIFDSFPGFGSKLIGYPFFTQYDPRSLDDMKKYNTLLLQLDSDGEYIEWGDGGVCNFFINDKALGNADFSDVLYNWDCY